MIATSPSHISFIQSVFLMKILGLDSNSNLVSVVKNLAQFKTLCKFGMHFNLILDYICSIKYEAFFTIARSFLDTRKKINDFFGTIVFLK